MTFKHFSCLLRKQKAAVEKKTLSNDGWRKKLLQNQIHEGLPSADNIMSIMDTKGNCFRTSKTINKMSVLGSSKDWETPFNKFFFFFSNTAMVWRHGSKQVWFQPCPLMCPSVLEQDTEPHISPIGYRLAASRTAIVCECVWGWMVPWPFKIPIIFWFILKVL